MKPQIVLPHYEGAHNGSDATVGRLEKGKTYQDLSTIIICPTRGQIPAKVVQSWMNMMRPMNQKVIGPMFAIGLEVGAAYNSMIEQILQNPDLAQWKYILTVEEDNMPPPDGLLRLYENMDKYDVIGGLYWTKGEEGQPMIYGDPAVMPKNFIPQIPRPDTVQPANGLGMGFNLWKLDIFKDDRLDKGKWFKTEQSYEPGRGSRVYTQDLHFFEKAGALGYKFACDTRVKVGHYDVVNDIVW
ncbi:MAG: hypothetical protein U0526_01500 [Candidatus Saccharibacteria bacterium]|jgi:hypothetical protein